MQAAYNPQLVYAATDIDLYAGTLLEQGKVDEAAKLYEKLAADFPNPDPAQPEKAPAQIQEAQAISLFGLAKALQNKGQVAQAAFACGQDHRGQLRHRPGGARGAPE